MDHSICHYLVRRVFILHFPLSYNQHFHLIREINCRNRGLRGISPSGSTVKHSRKTPRTSAFSLSDVVSLDVGSAGSVFRSETPTRVLVLEFIYFRMAL